MTLWTLSQGTQSLSPRTLTNDEAEGLDFWEYVKRSHQEDVPLKIIIAAMYGSKPSGFPSSQQVGSALYDFSRFSTLSFTQQFCTPVVFGPAETVSVLPEMSEIVCDGASCIPLYPGHLRDTLHASPLHLNLSMKDYDELLSQFHSFSNLEGRFGKLSRVVSQHLYQITAGQVITQITCVNVLYDKKILSWLLWRTNPFFLDDIQVGMITFFLDEMVTKLSRVSLESSIDGIDILAR